MPIRPGLPKLIATDLDGTLVRSDETVSAYSHEVLGRVRAAGIPLVGATGRGPRLIDSCLEFIPEADFLVLAQGARVIDRREPAAPVTLRATTVDGVEVLGVIEALEAVVGPLTVMVEARDEPGAPLWGERHPAWRYPDALEVRARHEALAGPVLKAFAHSPRYEPDELVAIAAELVAPDGVTVTQAGLGYIEICPPGVTKATGLTVIAESLGVDPRDVLVFGDMPNDLPMFGWAGWGRVAVASAHPEVRVMADEITLTNDEDGVAVYLDRLLSNG
jgi:Cof subfamily protein (haloacid dehalogenase superfamily)